MGVDVEVYRCRIGTFKFAVGNDVVIINCMVNLNGGVKVVGSVLFIGLLLLMSGIESNPGPWQNDQIFLYIIGFNVQAKCAVSNALLGRKDFRQFKSSMITKSKIGNKAFSGKRINIANTPNLDTPAWTYETIRPRNVFVYVSDPSRCVDIDIDNVLSNLQNIKPIYTIVTEFHESEKTSNNPGCICADWTFEMQKKWGVKLLKKIETRVITRNAAPPFERFIEDVHKTKSAKKTDTARQVTEESLVRRGTTDSFELVDEKNKEISKEQWALYATTLKYGRSTSNHVRVNFVGNQSAGKTTLVKRLQGIDIKCPDPEQKPTEALDINQITSKCMEIDGKRYWETAREGYQDELNRQRMAQAMNTIESILQNNGDMELFESQRSCDEIGQFHQEYLCKEDKLTRRSTEQILTVKKLFHKKDDSQGERRYISYWDFGGQSVYYSTHQVFMSPSAVYVLVFDLSKDWEEKNTSTLGFRSHVLSECSNEESLKYWISSIRSFTLDAKGGCAPILLVGTHLDKLRDKIQKSGNKRNDAEFFETKFKNEVDKKIKEVRDILQLPAVQCVTIDNKINAKVEIETLRNKILDLGLGLSIENVPVAWVELERFIRQEKESGKRRLSFDELIKLNDNLDFPMSPLLRLIPFLGYHHQRGQLLHFQQDDLKDLILLDPKIIAKFLNILMRSEDNCDQQSVMQQPDEYNINGVVNDRYVERCAEVMKKDGLDIEVGILLNVLKQLSIIHEFRPDETRPRFLLPCLLPPKGKGKGASTASHSHMLHRLKIEFPNKHLPPSFYHILIARLMNEWALFEKEVGKPEIYNLYACFRLQSDAQQVHVYWLQSRIYIEVINFSTSNKMKSDALDTIIQSIRKSISDIFVIYKHDNALYELYIQCPKCPKIRDGFVSISKLKNDEEAMCYGKFGEDHSIRVNEVFGKEDVSQKKSTKDLRSRPTEKELGRLALYLREDANALAIRIKLFLANIAADNIIANTPNVYLRRFMLLMRWKMQKTGTLGHLLELITVTRDYHLKDLNLVLFRDIKSHSYDIPSDILDKVPSDRKDISAASGCIGADYPFLFIELGLPYVEIERIDREHPDMVSRILHLFIKWRKEDPSTSTTRRLLDTAKFVGMDTTEMINKFKTKIEEK